MMLSSGGILSPLLTGLVGYWKLDETSGTYLYDSTANHKDLTYYSVTLNSTGKIGKSVYFTGNSASGIFLPNNWSVNRFLDNEITISMWVYLVNSPTQHFYFFDFRNTNEDSKIYANYNADDGALYFACMPATPNYNEYTYISAELLIGEWQHLAFVSTGIGTDSIKIYRNAIAVHERHFNMITAIDADLGGNFDVFGNSEYGNTDTINSYYDEIGIWNRALTSTEIATLYNSGNGKTHPF